MTPLMDMISRWKPRTDRGFRVVAFGSSNTELGPLNHGRLGWVEWLEVALRTQVGMHVTVTNAGVGGQTSADLIVRIGRDVAPINPDLVVVTIGGNDYWQMPVEQYRNNLVQIVRGLKKFNTAVVLQTYYSIMKSPPLAQDAFVPYMLAKREVAGAEGVFCVDTFPTMYAWHAADPVGYSQIMLDGGHLNAAGHAVFGTLCARAFGLTAPSVPTDIQQTVETSLKRLTPSRPET